MSSIHLRVVTPKSTVFEGDVADCTAPGATGEFGVLPEHISYLTAVIPGPLRFEHSGSQHAYAIGRGFIQVASDNVTVLCRYAESTSGIVPKDAATELEEAEMAFAHMGPDSEGYAAAEDRVLDARARVAVSG